MTIDPDRSPIHVIGSGRSGTTLLRMMLSAHPAIHLTHEASFYVWEGLWGRRAIDGLTAYYLQSPHFRWLGLDPSEVVAQVPRPLTTDTRRDLYAAVMRAAAARHGKRRWGDKTPSHSASLGRIFADWPDARVIRIVRDPRGTVHSLTRMPWATGSLVAASGFCEIERHQVAPYRDRILQIRLEDLMTDAEGTMRRVLDFVGEPWDDAVLDHPHHAPDDLPPVPWFARALEPRGTSPRPSWRRDWSPTEIRLVERMNKETMAEFGYPPDPLDTEPSAAARWARWARDLPEVGRGLWVAIRLALLARDPATFDGPAQKALFRRLNPAAWAALPGFDGIPDSPPLPSGWQASVTTLPGPVDR